MKQAYFTGIRSKIIQYLDEANDTIQIAMAWFTSSELFNTLLRSLERNVKVELVLLDNAINFMDYAPDFNLFIKAGGILRIADSRVGFMHHKFCIVDSKVAITGSYNWTYYAETRNVENIVVTDNKDIIGLFESEFLRLQKQLSISTSVQRLSWDDIETRDDVNYQELNYEIERICEVQNKPVRKVYEIKTEVVRTDIKLTPYSKYTIGIQALDNNRECFIPFINRNQILPYNSQQKEFFFDSKNRKEFRCRFLYGDPSNRNDWHTIKEEDLMQIAEGTSNEDLPIKFDMYLDDNGSLKVDISCTDSGKQLKISALDSSLVKYE